MAECQPHKNGCIWQSRKGGQKRGGKRPGETEPIIR